jgi:hypothetical protein
MNLWHSLIILLISDSSAAVGDLACIETKLVKNAFVYYPKLSPMQNLSRFVFAAVLSFKGQKRPVQYPGLQSR